MGFTIAGVLLGAAVASAITSPFPPSTEPVMQTDEDSIWFSVPEGSKIGFQIGDVSHHIVALAQAAKDASDVAASLHETVKNLTARVDNLEDEARFTENVNKALHQSMGKHEWITHSLSTDKVDTFRFLGAMHTDDVLHIDLQDVGCESGIGLTFVVSAAPGRSPSVLGFADADNELASRFQFQFQSISDTIVNVALKVKGWGTPCNGGEAKHTTTFMIRSTAGSFIVAEGSEIVSPSNFATIEAVSFTNVAAAVGLSSNAGSSSKTLIERVTNLESSAINEDEFASRVNTAMHRFEMEHDWITHSTDPSKVDTDFYIGVAHTDEVIHIDLEDTGCGSGFGISYDIQSRWGVDRGNDVMATTLGSYASDLTARFKFVWKALSFDTYHLAMKITGWNGNCNGRELPHKTSLVITSSSERFQLVSAPIDYDVTTFTVADTSDLDVEMAALRSIIGTPNTGAAPLATQISSIAQKTSSLQASMDDVNNDVKFKARVGEAINRYEMEHDWTSHSTDPSKVDTDFYIGVAHTDEVIHIDLEDTGCGSGFGISYDIQTRWGVDRGNDVMATTLGSYSSDLAARFKFVWKALSFDTYHLAMEITGWSGNCGGSERPHKTSLVITSSSERFRLADAPSDYDVATFTITDTSDVDTSIDSLVVQADALANKFEPSSFASLVNEALNRFEKKFVWRSHSADTAAGGEFVIGKGHTDQVVKIEVSDSGCNSGVGISYTLVAEWGIDLGNGGLVPEMYSFGAAHENMANRMTWVYKPLSRTEYVLGLKIAGWASCGPNAAGLNHELTIVAQASDDRFDDTYTGTIDSSYVDLNTVLFEQYHP